jgi:short-subunit dehydrogenase
VTAKSVVADPLVGQGRGARLAHLVAARRDRRGGIDSRDSGDEGRGKTALVTGASSGIGKAMTELLASKGFDVVVVARREQHLKQLQRELEARAHVSIHVLACDLSTPEAAERICAELDDRELAVDMLVNNAGYAVMGDYLKNAWSDHRDVVQTLALTPAELCWRLVPGMTERGWGRVINVSSIAALFAGSPQMVLYSGAKSLLVKFTEGLDAEVATLGARCTASIPGVTASDFFDRNSMRRTLDDNVLNQIAAMRCEDVARQAYRASMSGRRVIVHGWHHKLAGAILVHSPPAVRYELVRRLCALEFDPD